MYYFCCIGFDKNIFLDREIFRCIDRWMDGYGDYNLLFLGNKIERK